MLSVEMLIEMERLREANTTLYGGIVGFCVGAVAILVFMMVALIVSSSVSRKNKTVIKATDLIGEDVVYRSESITVSGQVVAVDYDLDDSAGIVTNVYIEVDGLDEYFKVDYAKNGTKIKLKENDDEHRAAD